MENKPCEDIRYGIVGADDAAPLAHLMMQERISLAGRVDPFLYRAFIQDGLDGRGPHIMVVKACGRIVGWSIGVIDSRRYWISFLGRHPATAIKVLACLFLQRYRNHKDASTLGRKSVASSGGHGEAVPTLQCFRFRRVGRFFLPTGIMHELMPVCARAKLTVAVRPRSDLERLPLADYDNWGKDGRHTARLIDTTVLPSFRGSGLGGNLQVHHLRALRKRGIRKAEAYVRVHKSGWLQFNARSGFRVAAQKANSVLIVIDLDQSHGNSE